MDRADVKDGQEPVEFSLLEPQETIAILVKDKTFTVYKALLAQDSEYFKDLFAREHDSTSITLDTDVSAREFGIYVDAVFHLHFQPNFILLPPNFELFPPNIRLGDLTKRISVQPTLWRLSGLFKHAGVRDIARIALKELYFHLSVSQWREYYEEPAQSRETLGVLLGLMYDGYKYFMEHRLPGQSVILDIAARMPAQLFREHQHNFDVSFQIDVMKIILERLEPSVPVA